MRILFIHQNAPGQFRHLAPHLAAEPGNQVVFLGARDSGLPAPVRSLRYPPPRPASPGTHQYLHRMENSVRRGQAVVRACLALKQEGFVPDVVVAHAGWGETMFLRDALPRTRLLSYCEMFYRADGQDTGFLPELPIDLDGRCRLRAWNADLLTGLEAMDGGLAPTEWQRAQHPPAYQGRIDVVHEGIDTAEAAPDPAARFTLPDGRTLTATDEVVTFVARNLEPVRGFTVLMRALPELLRRRPAAQVVICGAEGVSYGAPPPGGGTWRAALEAEAPRPDPARVHFVGPLPRPAYLALLQVSSLHLYLTVPFVLSWSCLEAMAAGCLLLGSDVAPVREVVQDGRNGALVDARRPGLVAERAAGMLAAGSALAPLRRAARHTAMERFALPRCLAAQARLVRKVAGQLAAAALAALLHTLPAAAQTPPAVQLRVTGPATPAIAGARPGCDPTDIPDAPARALRLSNGEVQLYAPSSRNRVERGPDLLHLRHDCTVVMVGAQNDDPAAFDDRAFIASPWTPDGRTIWAVVHNEFHGQRRPALCPSGRYMDCWFNALTAAVSRDNGRSFTRLPTDPLVAALPYRYDQAGLGHHGYFNPSNIVTHAGAQYMFAFATRTLAQRPGNCLLRTATLNEPRSWRAWDGRGFGVRFIDPYQETADPAQHVCAPLAPAALRWPVTSLVRHPRSGTFIALMQDTSRNGAVHVSTSPDLLAWSPPAHLMDTTGPGQWACNDPAPLAYPSLLDPASPDRNFETVGAAPRLYFTRFNVNDCRIGLDRELVSFPLDLR